MFLSNHYVATSWHLCLPAADLKNLCHPRFYVSSDISFNTHMSKTSIFIGHIFFRISSNFFSLFRILFISVCTPKFQHRFTISISILLSLFTLLVGVLLPFSYQSLQQHNYVLMSRLQSQQPEKLITIANVGRVTYRQTLCITVTHTTLIYFHRIESYSKFTL